ncbi:LysR family transcriptional regulator [Spirillospora sp. CA-294931]|uniref:LysR family transcriptional regulator n=1 Tax=Spirillospora sp. CA-294931 TaxID=3240042 RepID=UPI003D89B65D
MPEPEVRELRYFRAVAQELNLTRAARRLGMAQPPLSRAMRRLESRLGVALFDRSGRRLALTPAGKTLAEEAAAVLGALDLAVRRTRLAGLPDGALVVTAKPGVATELLRRIGARFGAELTVVVSGFDEQADMVRDGRADVAIAACFDGDGLDTEPLADEPRVAALAAAHPLAGRDVLRLADLAGEPAARWSGRADFPDRRAGGPVVRDSAELLEVVALGQAVALVPASVAAKNRRPDVTYRPVPDAAPYRTLALWPEGSRSPAIARFLAAARECVGSA